MTRYADRTKVPVIQTRSEIETLLVKYGADQFVYANAPDRAVIGFTMQDRQVRFYLPLGTLKPQQARQRWRALLLVIKAKLESIESGIEEFEEAFLGQIILPDGKQVAEWAKPQLEAAYKSGKMPALLPGPTP